MTDSSEELPELDDLFADDDYDLTEPPAPILDADRIDRRLAAYHRAKAEAEAFEKLAEARRSDLEARIELQGRPLAEKVGWLQRSLELSHAGLFADDPKRTRITFTNGVLTSKAGGVEWDYPEPGTEAEDDLVAWVQTECPDAYVPPVEPPARYDKNALKAAAKPKTLTKGRDGSQVPAHDDGSVVIGSEIVPGVTVKAKPRTFTPEVAL